MHVKKNGTKRKRFCLTLDLKDDPALIDEYRRIHQRRNIWPEIPQGMKEVGILKVEIYLLGARMFMILETEPEFEYEEQMARLSALPRQKEWEEFTWRFQSPVAVTGSGKKWMLMEKIYELP